jgi:DNA-binding NtrC family response regulator
MNDAIHVVIIEDEHANRESYERALTKIGYRIAAFPAAQPAIDYLKAHRDVVLVITDLMMPGIDGFGVLERAREIDSDMGVLMITGHGSVESAVDAMKRGADDYLTKPVDLFELRKRASTIVEKRLLSRKVVELESRLGEKFGKLIGKSRAMEALFRQMEMVAPTRSNVLIVGESGTGKELVANALHENSPRKDARFLPINCAAIPAEILESELFGHERGAFTDAREAKLGKIEMARGGTLYFDQVQDLSLALQAKLLRVVEERCFERVGGTRTIEVDVRFVSSTNVDLGQAVGAGRFREDLFHRLNVVPLRVPPLRERREDIAPLAELFLGRERARGTTLAQGFAPEAMEALKGYPWPGNVRELRSVVERSCLDAAGDHVPRRALPPAILEKPSALWAGRERRPSLRDVEQAYIRFVLDETGGSQTRTASVLGISRKALWEKRRRFGIP